jgi:hypothetical protein
LDSIGSDLNDATLKVSEGANNDDASDNDGEINKKGSK